MTEDTIYYLFCKKTGVFQGSGITAIDNEDIGYTTTPNSLMSDIWDGEKWNESPNRVDSVI